MGFATFRLFDIARYTTLRTPLASQGFSVLWRRKSINGNFSLPVLTSARNSSVDDCCYPTCKVDGMLGIPD